MITTQEVRDMIRPWLSGNLEKDAKYLRNKFRMLRFSIGEWRKIVSECAA